MGRLVYSAITSLDGYVNDATGSFDWAAPDDELHQYVNDRERGVGTYLYGRRMYEVMTYWESAPTEGDHPEVGLDYSRIWKSADKVVYSTTLGSVSTARTILKPVFEPDAVRALKESATSDLSVGGPGLAAHAFRAGLVDEVHLYLHPIVVGGGTSALPDGVQVPLELVDVHRFESGVVHLHHDVVG